VTRYRKYRRNCEMIWKIWKKREKDMKNREEIVKRYGKHGRKAF
jgi:hypothetical protein